MADTSARRKPASCAGGRPAGRSCTCISRTLLLALAVVCTLTLGACDPLTVHKVTSTIFDGVPSMPPAEQYCKDYHEKAVKEEQEAALRQRQASQGNSQSQHPPFAQRRCSNCHDKNTESGFVVAADELCGHCHKGFPKGEYLHGPAAVGACLKCHVPHTSDNPNLLVKSKKELCVTCHKEPRVAAAMHEKVIANGMYCTDCHNPHGGNNRYFLR